MTILCSEHARIVFLLAEAIQGFSADIQAQYLVLFDGNQKCSAHCK